MTVIADPQQCSFQFDPIGKNKFDSTSCDIAKSFLAKAGVSYQRSMGRPAAVAQIRAGADHAHRARPAQSSTDAERKAAIAAFQSAAKKALTAAGYPDKADPASINKPMVVLILFILVLYVTMVYGPIAALLVELFPARIRYSAMSLPYHIGNGWFGGFLPTTAFAMVAATGDIYYGLWYPIVVAGAHARSWACSFCPRPSSARSRVTGSAAPHRGGGDALPKRRWSAALHLLHGASRSSKCDVICVRSGVFFITLLS